MQTSQNIFPIIHPQRFPRPTRSWKHRVNKQGKSVRKVTQYRIVAMA
jgi:hypothetical protein